MVLVFVTESWGYSSQDSRQFFKQVCSLYFSFSSSAARVLGQCYLKSVSNHRIIWPEMAEEILGFFFASQYLLRSSETHCHRMPIISVEHGFNSPGLGGGCWWNGSHWSFLQSWSWCLITERVRAGLSLERSPHTCFPRRALQSAMVGTGQSLTWSTHRAPVTVSAGTIRALLGAVLEPLEPALNRAQHFVLSVQGSNTAIA